MLPPLLGLLLDCAKKTDQSVVSISLGALVHLIEVGGHQFCDSDWDTLLKSIRHASYTTQPLALLNSLSFNNSRSHAILTNNAVNRGDSPSWKSGGNAGSETHHFDRRENGKAYDQASSSIDGGSSEKNLSASAFQDDNQENELQTDVEGSEGLPSPLGRAQKNPGEAESFQRSQTFGQRIMGNMMDNLLLRSFTSKSKSRPADVLVPSSPIKIPDAVESSPKDEDQDPLWGKVRGKCITQLLLLGAIDSIQRKYWSKLKAPQKIAIMDILLSVLEFAASYNSYSNLRTRMHHIPSERPPLNLLRQEIAGTSIYLDILQKTTSRYNINGEEPVDTNGSVATPSVNDPISTENVEEKLNFLAEEKLVSFCQQILKEASDLQPSTGEAASVDIHRVLELRSPIIVKVLDGMRLMNSQIFRKHLREFYPLMTKLVCCDQMDVRGALGDLFSTQLTALVP